MPTYTSFLDLALPGLGEFLNSWQEPVNQNFELIDDHLAALRKALVTGAPLDAAPAEYALLVGSLYNLADRLAVSILPDGTLDLSNSPAIADLGSSATNGDDYNGDSLPDNSPRNRFDYSDLEVWNARSAGYGDRFSVAPTGRGLLDVGIAHRTRDNGVDSGHAIASPSRSFSSGLVAGPDTFLAGVASNQVKFDATVGTATSWPMFNIDGFLFRIRDAITLDMTADSTGAILANGNFVYLYVERVNYSNSNLKVKKASDPGAAFAQDLRIVQNGVDGAISGKTFSSASALFNGSAAKRAVIAGDLLVVDGTGPAAGSYVIKSVDTANQVTVSGTFKADLLSGLTWHVQDDAHPSVGCVKVTDINTDPPYVAGRVYVGRGELNASNFRPAGGSPMTKIAFPVSGIYDSGWVATAGALPMTLEHNFGCLPSSVEVWVRQSSSGEAYLPTIPVSVLLNPTGNQTIDTPSLMWKSTRQKITIRRRGANLFALDTDSLVADGELRLIARR